MDHSAHMDHSGHMDHNAHTGHTSQGVHDHDHHMDTNITKLLDSTFLTANPLNTHDTLDHTDHSNHPTHQNMMEHMMSMSFHGGYNETILFTDWKIESLSGLIYSMIVIFIFAGIYEGLKYYREYLFWKTYNSLQYRAVTVPEKNGNEENGRVVHMVGEVIHKQPPSMLSKMHLFQTILHIIQVTISFLLMLIFMTYNVWLCLAVVLGTATGYFLFGWKKSVAVDVTEHCH